MECLYISLFTYAGSQNSFCISYFLSSFFLSLFHSFSYNLFVLPSAGGPWMLTDMRRGESIYELDPSVAEEVENGIENDGSNLSGVSARLAWTEDEASSLVSEFFSFSSFILFLFLFSSKPD